jgi:syntaxin-binding protein 1
MLGTVRDQSGGAWSVLVLDVVTTKVLSRVCRVSDIMDYGVSCELNGGKRSAEPEAACRD